MNFSQAKDILALYGISLIESQYKRNQQQTVIVGMSGGVDSSVSALLIKLQGFKVLGLFMKNWEEKDENGQCTSEQDSKDAKDVCAKLNIPFYVINFVDEYKKNVFESFLADYKAGHTPNPDILCNKEIKFKAFYNKAMELGADYLATGHYCQKELIDNVWRLKKGYDALKDQSYFLYAIDPTTLNKVLFPIGHIEKKSVRGLAQKFNLITFNKKDSTGICFIGERNFKNFLNQYIKQQEGNFVRLDNQAILASHQGSCFYTIGQRKGLGLGGPGGPWFVASKDIDKNIVYVVEGSEHPALFANYLIADNLNWIGPAPQFPIKCTAKIRYRQSDVSCYVEECQQGIKVSFDIPQRAIALKQSVVLYQGNICLGGGVIQEHGPTLYDQQQNATNICHQINF